ncbi:YjgF-like protein [Periconia macrospinosa]|uniref:YjgF-like protein n=1 Tax=Periconia macrospinosa TaxID=97972 RepID=A0A2V1DW34_9PLEO|nr:YjgF-like protein [Periconia macrospinosa]
MPSENLCFNPPGHDTPVPVYSHISSVPISSTHNLVSFAGQIGRDSSNQVPKTLGAQVSIALANVDKCLDAANATKDDIVQVRQYIVNLLHDRDGATDVPDPERVKLYAEWMGGRKPPSTVLGVQSLALKEYLYEIEVVCVVKRTT